MVKFTNEIIIPKFNKLKKEKIKMSLISLENKGKKEIFQFFTIDNSKSRKKAII